VGAEVQAAVGGSCELVVRAVRVFMRVISRVISRVKAVISVLMRVYKGNKSRYKGC
jgi:hypothetical protein